MIYKHLSKGTLKRQILLNKRLTQLMLEQTKDLEAELERRHKYRVVELLNGKVLIQIRTFNTRKIAEAFASWLSRGSLRELDIQAIPNA